MQTKYKIQLYFFHQDQVKQACPTHLQTLMALVKLTVAMICLIFFLQPQQVIAKNMTEA